MKIIKQAVGMKFFFTSKFKTLKIVAINTKLIQTHIKLFLGAGEVLDENSYVDRSHIKMTPVQ